ncbi:GspH/FimT family pseudopilin [Pseudorhodoferax sp.]|uniref:GspH/FimT family pseudopilin n=1 Tax=Pseudorhodoferax sp. TaxID=1993553 RepID=UPI002DD6976A|nr:GspH/FimT family pseudopilin [Pseudorhodoferax sp.]
MTPSISLPCARRAAAGITLVETMVCVFILAVLASLAAPAFRDMLLRQRVGAARSELTTALQWARWEAIRRNAAVALERRTDCPELLRSPNDWHCGWNIVSTTPDDAQVLQAFQLPRGVRMVHANGGATLQFSRSGMPAQVAHKFIVSHSTEVTPLTTALCMNRTGRVRTVTGQATC